MSYQVFIQPAAQRQLKKLTLAIHRCDRTYEGMNIPGVTRLTKAQNTSLQALSAVESELFLFKVRTVLFAVRSHRALTASFLFQTKLFLLE